MGTVPPGSPGGSPGVSPSPDPLLSTGSSPPLPHGFPPSALPYRCFVCLSFLLCLYFCSLLASAFLRFCLPGPISLLVLCTLSHHLALPAPSPSVALSPPFLTAQAPGAPPSLQTLPWMPDRVGVVSSQGAQRPARPELLSGSWGLSGLRRCCKPWAHESPSPHHWQVPHALPQIRRPSPTLMPHYPALGSPAVRKSRGVQEPSPTLGRPRHYPLCKGIYPKVLKKIPLVI